MFLTHATCVVSADMAEAMHPSQVCPPSQDETFHQPKLREGLVLKHDAGNSNDMVTSFLFREVAKRNSIPTQVRSLVLYIRLACFQMRTAFVCSNGFINVELTLEFCECRIFL